MVFVTPNCRLSRRDPYARSDLYGEYGVPDTSSLGVDDEPAFRITHVYFLSSSGERQSSLAVMERSGIPVQCSALFDIISELDLVAEISKSDGFS